MCVLGKVNVKFKCMKPQESITMSEWLTFGCLHVGVYHVPVIGSSACTAYIYLYYNYNCMHTYVNVHRVLIVYIQAG